MKSSIKDLFSKFEHMEMSVLLINAMRFLVESMLPSRNKLIPSSHFSVQTIVNKILLFLVLFLQRKRSTQ